MKYIKKYETLTEEEIINVFGSDSVGIDELIPGYMYYDNHLKQDICFIVNNGTEWPLTCLLFRDDKEYFDFIEWAEWMKFKPLNITLKDYIIKNNIVGKTIKSFMKPKFSSGPAKKSKSIKTIKSITNMLLSDDDITVYLDAEKYKL